MMKMNIQKIKVIIKMDRITFMLHIHLRQLRLSMLTAVNMRYQI